MDRGEAIEVASKTEDLLRTRGWVVWQCSNLGGDQVVIVRDAAMQLPLSVAGLPSYTNEELQRMFSRPMDRRQLRLVHEAKKRGAVVTASE